MQIHHNVALVPAAKSVACEGSQSISVDAWQHNLDECNREAGCRAQYIAVEWWSWLLGVNMRGQAKPYYWIAYE